MHWPTDHNDSGNVISPFGWRTWGNKPQFHEGTDFGADLGDRFLTPETARITEHYHKWPYGWITLFISLDGRRLWETHGGVEQLPFPIGSQVGEGGCVDFSGDSESRLWSSGPHLHLGCRDTATGQYLDPLKIIQGGAMPESDVQILTKQVASLFTKVSSLESFRGIFEKQYAYPVGNVPKIYDERFKKLENAPAGTTIDYDKLAEKIAPIVLEQLLKRWENG